MIAAPAVDLRRGRCVQLVGGRPEDERVSLPDPVAVARSWRAMGFGTLHFVDLDAALSDGDNRALLRELVEDARAGEDGSSDRGTGSGASEAGSARPGAAGPGPAERGSAAQPGPAESEALMPDSAPVQSTVTQAGGGVRDDAAVLELLDAGVDRVIVGTRAVDDAEWLAAIATAHPGRIMVAADLRDGVVLRRGWTEASRLAVLDFLDGLNAHPLAGVLCTDVAREGRLAGIDLPQSERLVRASSHPIWISGGIHSMEDLRGLEASGAAGVVLGMALYTGALDGETVAREWGS